jgi:Protein of unknown function (DUF2992).
MDKVLIKFQVFFEEPFWIGICERVVGDQLAVSKITFGAEPKDYDIEEYILRNWYRLCFSPTTEIVLKHKNYVNPKRLQREVQKQITGIGIGTKSQQALKLQHEQNKCEYKLRVKRRKRSRSDYLF